MRDGDSAPHDAVPSDNRPPFDRATSDSGPAGGDASHLDSGTSTDGATSLDSGTSSDGDAPTAGLQLVVPLSTATVTSRRPVLRWALENGVDGAHVDICRDRSCTNLVTSFDVTGSSAAPSVELSAGLYFWRAYARRGVTTSIVSTPVWQFWVGARSASVNASWGSVTDVDGDGWLDAIIAGESSKIDVFAGVGRNGTTMHNTLLLPNGAGLLSGIASAGDVNGDGYPDLIIGARGIPDQTAGQPTPGAAFVYAGSTTGLSSPPELIHSHFAMDLGFGSNVTSAGDVNGDGYADVIIEGDQAVYLYLGGPNGLRSNPATLDNNTFNFAPRINSAGDLNGDGYGDVIIGAPNQGAGRVYVYLGSAAGLSLPIVIDGPDGGTAAFGASLGCAGDTNGDGYADFIVSELGPGGAGRAYVYLGSTSGFSMTPIVLSRIGMPATSAGDLNGDGYDDIILADTQGTAAGAGIVYIFFGGANGPSSTPAAFEGYPTPHFGDGFGTALVRGGDVDHDGYGDILIGSPRFNQHRGRATILFGSPAIAPPGRRVLIDQAERMGFGVFIAGG
jgi:hypothetical protein